MYTGPYEAAIGVDVNLADAELSCRKILGSIYTLGTIEDAAGCIDALDFILWNRGRTVHHEWEARKVVLDGFDHIEVDALSAGELVSAVAGSDGTCEGVAACALDEFLSLLRIGQTCVGFINIDVFLDAAEHSELSFDGDADSMRTINHTLGDSDVLLEVFGGCIDHDRAIEARVNTVVAGLFITMVEVNSKDSFRVEGVRGADHRLKE